MDRTYSTRGDFNDLVSQLKVYINIGHLGDGEKNRLDSYIHRLNVYVKSDSTDADLLIAYHIFSMDYPRY